MLLCACLIVSTAARADSSWTDPSVIVNGIFSCLLVIVGILQWRVYRNQKEIMHKTLLATEKASHAAAASAQVAVGAQLPRLVMRKIDLTNTTVESTAAKFQSPNVRVKFRNYGGTIAFIETQSLEVYCGAHLPKTPEYPNAYDLDPESIVESQEYHSIDNHREMIPDDDYKAVLAEKRFLWVYGFVQYKDFLGNRHIVRFGKQLLPVTQSKKDYRFVEIGNDAYLGSSNIV
jgi:hypothetical protein